jgi:hypothetical protein
MLSTLRELPLITDMATCSVSNQEFSAVQHALIPGLEMVKVSGIYPKNPTPYPAGACRVRPGGWGLLVLGEKSDTTISFKTLGP